MNKRGNKSHVSRIIRSLAISMTMLMFVSCDPMQTLVIKNQTGSDAKVTFLMKKGEHAYNFEGYSESDTFLIDLDTTLNNSHKEYHFGLGHWKINGVLDSLASSFESIEIETSRSKETFQGGDQIKQFFEDRISKKQKQLIEINLE